MSPACASEIGTAHEQHNSDQAAVDDCHGSVVSPESVAHPKSVKADRAGSSVSQRTRLRACQPGALPAPAHAPNGTKLRKQSLLSALDWNCGLRHVRSIGLQTFRLQSSDLDPERYGNCRGPASRSRDPKCIGLSSAETWSDLLAVDALGGTCSRVLLCVRVRAMR